MPDRILRAELLTSEAWLALKNNDDRVCWIVLLLHADTFGNQPAGPHRLVHIWRHAGVDTTEKAAKVLLELTEVDLARTYPQDGKTYVHIPRFKQSRRYLGKLWPLSPWTLPEEKERLKQKSPVDHSETPEVSCDAPEGVGVGVGVGVDKNGVGVLPPVARAHELAPHKPETLPQALKPVLEKLTGKERPQPRTREEQLAYVDAQTKAKA